MKILFDHQTFENQKFGGISRYFFELIKQFDTDQTVVWDLAIQYSDNYYIKTVEVINEILRHSEVIRPDAIEVILNNIDFIGKSKVTSLKNRLIPSASTRKSATNKEYSIHKIKEGNFDIFHPTYYDDYFLDYIGSKPYVLTVYDLIHQIFPELYLNASVDKTKEMMQNAARILAISESTKRDLISIYGIDESKIVVTHLATSLDSSSAEPSRSFQDKVPKQFLLFVGVRGGYKNFLFFAQAFAIVAKKNKNLCLVCTGPAFQEHEINYFKKLNIENVTFHYNVNDDELAYLYQNTEAFVFPSMYEGFGIPILEAFSCSCPVLVSRGSSLSEIGGDAVLYFEPKDISSLIAALENILNKSGPRENLIARGHLQLKKFSWEKNANKTKEVYRQIMSRNG